MEAMESMTFIATPKKEKNEEQDNNVSYVGSPRHPMGLLTSRRRR